MRKHWHVTHINYCPVCGREGKWRERVYVKPIDSLIWNEVYDWCDAL